MTSPIDTCHLQLLECLNLHTAQALVIQTNVIERVHCEIAKIRSETRWEVERHVHVPVVIVGRIGGMLHAACWWGGMYVVASRDLSKRAHVMMIQGLLLRVESRLLETKVVLVHVCQSVLGLCCHDGFSNSVAN